MKGFTADYNLMSPKNLPEALEWLALTDARPFAGGTDLMVQLEAGRLPKGNYLSLHRLQELKQIIVTDHEVRIGAGVTYSEIRKHPLLQSEFPMLVQAAKLTGAWAIQNRGTLAGNIANASPAADSPPALLCYEAKLEIVCYEAKRESVSQIARRQVAYRDFHQGYKKTDLHPHELISQIILPRLSQQSRDTNAQNEVLSERHYYRKVGTRAAQSITKVSLAGRATVSTSLASTSTNTSGPNTAEQRRILQVRLALASVGPTVTQAVATENFLKGQILTSQLIQEARKILAKEIHPLDDIRSTKEYRKHVAQNLLEEFLNELLD